MTVNLPVLSVQGLSVRFPAGAAVQNVSLTVNPGEMVALVGESGCGKTQTALSILGLQSETATVSAEQLLLSERSLLQLSEDERGRLRGQELAMIFQEPMTALNPLMKIGRQVAEAAQVHGCPKQEAKERALEMLRLVGLPDAERLYEEYPHRLSGGQRQRVMIAAALINHPMLLVADEPTTALDVTTQAQILELLRRMNEELNTAVLLISHDLEVVRRLCSRVYLMYAGQVVEAGTTEQVLAHPQHPYTKGLLSSVPGFTKRGQMLRAIPGQVPELSQRDEHGCPFYSRCEYRRDHCRIATPPMTEQGGHAVRCFEIGGEYGH